MDTTFCNDVRIRVLKCKDASNRGKERSRAEGRGDLPVKVKEDEKMIDFSMLVFFFNFKES